jgi:CDP-paratose 2-epimerase
MSCIYGPHQFGTEDQGWVAHFLIRALKGEPITIYGDGMQVRDILYVEDLVDAFLLAQVHMPKVRGQAFNIGGGVANTISLLELLDQIEELSGRRPQTRGGAWRPGDQRYYVSDTHKMNLATGWAPKVSAREGVGRLYSWLCGTLPARRRSGSIPYPGAGPWPSEDGKRASHSPARRSRKEVL